MTIPCGRRVLDLHPTSPSNLSFLDNTQSSILLILYLLFSVSTEVRRASEQGICGSKLGSFFLTGNNYNTKARKSAIFHKGNNVMHALG